MLEHSFYPWLVQAAKPLGLNFAFLLEAYERDAFIRGLGVTLQLCLLVIPGSLIAGVLLAAVVPVAASPTAAAQPRLAEEFSRRFAPLSTFLAVPLFAFFAAGVAVGGESRFPADPIAIGIMLGLVLGKPLGIVLTTLALTRFTRAELGPGVRLRELIGVGMLAGAGFTVSLLIAELSFEDAAHADTARLAVLAGSVISVLSSTLLLSYSRRKRP